MVTQYKVSPEGKKTTTGTVIKGTNLKYLMYLPKGLAEPELMFGLREILRKEK
jgi:hypothetical protein